MRMLSGSLRPYNRRRDLPAVHARALAPAGPSPGGPGGAGRAAGARLCLSEDRSEAALRLRSLAAHLAGQSRERPALLGPGRARRRSADGVDVREALRGTGEPSAGGDRGRGQRGRGADPGAALPLSSLPHPDGLADAARHRRRGGGRESARPDRRRRGHRGADAGAAPGRGRHRPPAGLPARAPRWPTCRGRWARSSGPISSTWARSRRWERRSSRSEARGPSTGCS
jgi:hypothetical protein